MTRKAKVKFNKNGWNEVVRHIVDTEGVKRMTRVADASNADIEGDGFMVSTEGDDPLDRRDYTATVITTTPEAMRANAKHNLLIKNLHRASGN